MMLAIECIVLSVLFSLGIFIPLYKNPIGQIMSYPASIRKRVESLPQYRDSIKKREQKHILIKLLSVFVFALFLCGLAYGSGARSVPQVCRHVFILFFAVNLYDLLIMDLLIFRHCRAFRIPGTEDMDREYKECWHHIRGFGIGTGLGLLVSGLAGLIYMLFQRLL